MSASPTDGRVSIPMEQFSLLLQMAGLAQLNQVEEEKKSITSECMHYVFQDEKTGTRTNHQINFRRDGNKIADGKGNTWLHIACHAGSEDMLLGFIQQGGKELNLEVRNQKDQTPLMVAVEAGRQKIVETLLDNGADVDARQWETGQTALFIAASRGDLQLTQLLLAKRARITEVSSFTGSGSFALHKSETGVTPVFLAALTGNIELVQLLIDAGDDPHRTIGGQNILRYAVDHPPLVRMLYLVHKVNINDNCSPWGGGKCTPLFWVKDIDLFIFFLENGAEVDDKLFSHFFYSSFSPKNGSPIDFVIAVLKHRAAVIHPASLQDFFLQFSEYFPKNTFRITPEKVLEATKLFLSNGVRIEHKIREIYDNYLKYQPQPELKQLLVSNDKGCTIS